MQKLPLKEFESTARGLQSRLYDFVSLSREGLCPSLGHDPIDVMRRCPLGDLVDGFSAKDHKFGSEMLKIGRKRVERLQKKLHSMRKLSRTCWIKKIRIDHEYRDHLVARFDRFLQRRVIGDAKIFSAKPYGRSPKSARHRTNSGEKVITKRL